MKQFLLPFLAGIVIACTSSTSEAQQAKETITKEFAAPRSGVVAVYNIHGPVTVEGYNGDKVLIEVKKTISAKESAVLEQGKKELQVRFSEEGDSLIAYIAEPFDSRPNHNRNNKNVHIDYSFELEYHLKVPAKLNVVAHTINKGDVEVSDVSGNLTLNNINGNVKVRHARGLSSFRTINGDVTADYPVAPPANSTYYTLNGNIKISYPADLSADVRFKSFQGDFYTDFSDTEVLPAQAEKNQDKKGDKTVYRLSKTSSIRIGKGGRGLNFETFNGNVYLKKQTL